MASFMEIHATPPELAGLTGQARGYRVHYEEMNLVQAKAFPGGRLIVPDIQKDLKARPETEVNFLDLDASIAQWLIDVRTEYPKAHFYGSCTTDQHWPTSRDNLNLFIQNPVEHWPKQLEGKFDMIRSRVVLVVHGLSNVDTIIDNLRFLLKPGGWIQLIEFALWDQEKNDNGPVLRQYASIMEEVCQKTGGDARWIEGLPEKLRARGFEDIHMEELDWWTGVRAPEEEKRTGLAKEGVNVTAELVQAVLSRMKPMIECVSAEDVDTMAERYKAECISRGGNVPFRVVWARKKQ